MPSKRLTGTVRDLDYMPDKTWCQVLIGDAPPSRTADVRLLRVLRAAMFRGTAVTVTFGDDNPAIIEDVTIAKEAAGDDRNDVDAPWGTVLSLTVDSRSRKAEARVMLDKPKTLHSNADKVLFLLTAAFEHSFPLDGNSSFSDQGEILRVKLNKV